MRILATPNCPCPPVCFLYLPSASASLVIDLPVGDLDVLDVDVHAELPVQPLAGDREVGLPGAEQKGLMGLVDPGDRQRRVLLPEAVESGHQLVLVPLGTRLDRDREHMGFGVGCGYDDGSPLGCEGVAGGGPRKLRHRHDVTRLCLWNRLGFLAPEHLEHVELFVRVCSRIVEDRVRANGPGDHLQK